MLLILINFGFLIFIVFTLLDCISHTKMATGQSQADIGRDDIPRLLQQIVDTQQNHVDAYRVPRIPKFYRDDPSCWFIQIEASFAQAGLRDGTTKAHTLIANLDANLIAHIKDIITMNPQPNDLYTRIKNRLLSSFSVSPESRLRQLLKGEVISDGKPSLLSNRLRNLNDGNCSDEIIKTIFLDQLPAKLRGILALSNVDGLQALAQLADKVLDAMGPNEFNVSATTLAPDPCQLSISAIASTANLADMIETLNRKLDKLSREVNRSSRSLSRDRASSRSNSRSYSRNGRQNSQNRDLCFYHRKYGKKAKKCNQPCSWTPPYQEN